ncbi:MAG: sensor histidine kinase [Streptococcus salivarius]
MKIKRLVRAFSKGIAQVDAYVKELSELNKTSLTKSLTLEDISVREFVEDIYDQTLSLAQTKQINVAFDKKEIKKAIIGHWDRSLLNRAFMNIVSNAVEYTPSGSQLLLTARVEEMNSSLSTLILVLDFPLNLLKSYSALLSRG